MKVSRYLLFIPLLCFVVTSLPAQVPEANVNEGSIQDQFEFVIKKSTNWNDSKGQPYEVIKRQMIQSLKTNVLDSLRAMQAQLAATELRVSTQQQEIHTLKAEVAQLKETLAATNLEKDSMVLFGNQLSKGSYSFIMWSAILTLLALLVFFVLKFKNSNIVTQDAKRALAEMETEYKEHRRLALEREQKIKRQLQDQINKYADQT